MSFIKPVKFETPIVFWHSIDEAEPALPRAVRVCLCEDGKSLAESWMESEGVIVLHASTYSERLAQILDYTTQALPEAPLVVMLNFPDMRMERLLELGAQEVVTNSAELIPAIRTAATRKARECALRSNRYLDPLTGLPNRYLFQDRLEHSLEAHKRSKQPMGLVILDLDHFHRLSESFGHSAGDAVLIELTERLRSVTRKSDTLARIGGNTFALIAENLRQTRNLIQVCEKISAQLDVPVTFQGEKIKLSGSIGAALAGEADHDAGNLMLHAEQVLSGAKQIGQNSYVIYSAHSAEDRIRGGLEMAIYHALDNRQISMEYQPQMSMDGQRLYGVEALMRWNHPVFGHVPPEQFIPVLETTGLIEKFGMWAIESACQQFRQWLDDGLMPEDARVSVNLTSRQFFQPDLADQVLGILDEVGLAGKHLTLEITEAMIMEGNDRTADTLARLRFENIAIAIDDFGTGYSSFASLRTLPVDYLKIDRDFVKSVGINNDDDAIAGSIIHLAHSLKLKVIAEGVEQVSTQSRLAGLGCDECQGYLFSKPIAADRMPEFVARCA